jgi:hypothetical protein
MKRFWINTLILFILLIPVITEAQQVKAVATIDTAELLIGQQRKITLGVDFPKGNKLVWPVIPDTLPNGIEIISKGKIDTLASADQNRMSLQQILTITSFDTGMLMIPPVYFFNDQARDSAHVIAATDPFMIQVHTIEVDTTRAFRDIKGPLKAPVTFLEMLPWIAGVIGLVAVIWLLVYYFFLRKKNKPLLLFPRKPDVPAYLAALEDFEKLRQTKLWQSGRVKEYHSELTGVLRLYIEQGYGFQALEMTSDEILEKLRERLVDQTQLGQVQEVLTIADLVKFAKAIPLPDVHDQSLRQSIDFVNATRLNGVGFNQSMSDTSNTPAV